MNGKKVAVIKEGGLEVWFYQGSKLEFSIVYQTEDIAKQKAMDWIKDE